MLNSLQDKLARLATAYYGSWASLSRRIDQFFRLGKLSSLISSRLSKPFALMGIELLAAFSLTVYFFFLVCPQAEAPRSYDHNEMNMFLFTRLSNDPYPAPKDILADFSIWEARLPGQIMTGWIDNQAFNLAFRCYQLKKIHSNLITFGGYTFSTRWVAFGFYHALWLWLLFLLLIWYRRDALLIMLGVFSGLMFNFIIPAGRWFFPWDMPTMFFFTWACLLFDKRRMLPLMAVVVLGGLFKETTLCCALLILFAGQWPLKKRLIGFGMTAVIYLFMRKVLMGLYGVHTMLFALNNSTSLNEMAVKTWLVLLANIQQLFRLQLNQVALANVGTLFLIVVIPWRNWRQVALKIVAVSFLVGQFLCGSVCEFRIWYELLPLGWILLNETALSRFFVFHTGQAAPRMPQPCSAEETRRAHIMQGSYWLMMSALLVLALGLWGMSKTQLGYAGESSKVAESVGLHACATNAPTGASLKAATDRVLQIATTGSIEEAIRQSRELVRLYPHEPLALNNLALLLATSSKSELRNGTEALQLANTAVQLTGHREHAFVATLATAYAQEGNYSVAATLAKYARDLALFNEQQKMAAIYQQYFKEYSAAEAGGTTGSSPRRD